MVQLVLLVDSIHKVCINALVPPHTQKLLKKIANIAKLSKNESFGDIIECSNIFKTVILGRKQ